MNRSILPARTSDLIALQRLAEEVFTVPWPMAELEKELSRPYAAVRVLRAEGRIVAYLNYWRLGDELQIMNVATATAERRRGHARCLIEDVVATARLQGLSAVSLEVRIGNEPAIALYHSLEFARVGVRPRYYSDNGEDALVMRRDLHAG